MSALYIGAVGLSRPETKLQNIGLKDINKEGLAFPVPDLRTALDPAYLTETLNADPYGIDERLTETPTSLAAQAAQSALEKAEIEASQLGLILGATSTGLQTTPFESQRVGKELQVKIPAYDVSGGGVDLGLQCENLLSWKSDRVVDYTLCLSTHIPTSRIDYRDGIERFIFGDAGAAFVVSKERGPYRLVQSVTKLFPAAGERFTIDLYGHLHYDESIEQEIFIPALAELVESLRPTLSKSCLFVESQLLPDNYSMLREVIGGENWKSLFAESGNLFGACAGASLALLEEQGATDFEQIVLLQSGLGLSVGALVLSREE